MTSDIILVRKEIILIFVSVETQSDSQNYSIYKNADSLKTEDIIHCISVTGAIFLVPSTIC